MKIVDHDHGEWNRSLPFIFRNCAGEFVDLRSAQLAGVIAYRTFRLRIGGAGLAQSGMACQKQAQKNRKLATRHACTAAGDFEAALSRVLHSSAPMETVY